MSYYKAKNISFNKKKNQINITLASNNLKPLRFYTVEFGDRIPDFDAKVKALFKDILSGELKPYPSCSKGDIYIAFIDVATYLAHSHHCTVSDLWRLDEREREQMIDELYPIFKSGLNL